MTQLHRKMDELMHKFTNKIHSLPVFCINISCLMHINICPSITFLVTLFYRLDPFCACTGLTDQQARLIRYLHLWSQLPKAQMHKKEEVCHKCMITAVVRVSSPAMESQPVYYPGKCLCWAKLYIFNVIYIFHKIKSQNNVIITFCDSLTSLYSQLCLLLSLNKCLRPY